MDSATKHIMEVAEETGIDFAISDEFEETYNGFTLEFFYDQYSYMYGYKCFVKGIKTLSGESFEDVKQQAIELIDNTRG